MASGYERFTNEICDVEGGRHDVPPPSYEQTDTKPTAPACYHPDQTPCPMQKVPEYPGQQSSHYPAQQLSQYPQENASQYPAPEPSQYLQQNPPVYGQQEASQYPAQYPLQQPSKYPLQQPSQYPQAPTNTYVYQPQVQVTQPPVQQNIVHVTNQPMPNDYFGFALFVTLCCCLPFGIVALIKSSEVKSRSAAGDFHGAAFASAEAKRWSTIALIFGGISVAVAVVGGIVSATSGAAYTGY